MLGFGLKDVLTIFLTIYRPCQRLAHFNNEDFFIGIAVLFFLALMLTIFICFDFAAADSDIGLLCIHRWGLLQRKEERGCNAVRPAHLSSINSSGWSH